MLKLETSMQFKNYLDDLIELQVNDHTKAKEVLRECDRSYCVTRIFELIELKGYKMETCYLAVNILDRYLTLKAKNFNRDQLPLLTVACMILGAKLE